MEEVWKSRVRLGLTLYLTSVALQIIGSLVVMAFGLSILSLIPSVLLPYLILGAVPLCVFLSLAGQVLCTFVPSETGARGYAIANAIFQAIYLGFHLLQAIVSLPFWIDISGSIGSSLLMFVGNVMFTMFLVRMGQHLNNDEISDYAIKGILASVVAVVTAVAGVAFLFTAPSLFVLVSWLAFMSLPLIFLYSLGMYLLAVVSLRQALSGSEDRSTDAEGSPWMPKY